MNNRYYEQSPRFNAAGLATGLILALIVGMAISVVFDVQPAEAKSNTAAAHMVVTARV
jgi:hypothetical protein